MTQLFEPDEATAARRRFFLFLVDATDGLTPEDGESGGQPQISKNGAAFANTDATLTFISNGAYYVELTVAELDTRGKITVRYKSANTAEFNETANVGVDVNVIEWLENNVSASSTNLPQVDAQEISDSSAAAATLSSNISNLDEPVSNQASPTEVRTQVDAALAAVNLDHLVGTATAIPAVPAGTYLDQIMDDGTASFDRSTDSLQAIRDRGDLSWTTATGFSTSADVLTQCLAALDTAIGGSPTADSMNERIRSMDILTEASGAGDLAAILIDTNSLNDAAISELAQGQPTATPTVKQALMLLYMALRNQLDVSATEKAVYNDAGTKISKKALTDTGTYSEAKMVSGP